MHQCPNPETVPWDWAHNVWHITEKKLQEASLINNNKTKIIRRGHEVDKDELLCFEDMYLSMRTGHWLQGSMIIVFTLQEVFFISHYACMITGSDNLISFRKEAARVTGEPKDALKMTEIEPENKLLQSYCKGTSMEKTNARIRIFQRTRTQEPRSFVNIDEVKTLIQQYTDVPVEIITTTEMNTIQEQIRFAYYSFYLNILFN